MKGIILKDLLNSRKNLKNLLIMCFLYAIIFSTMNLSALSSVITILFTMQILTTFSYDDYTRWNQYALSLPISKKQLVLSKYILSLLFIIIGSIISLLLAITISLIKNSLLFDDVIGAVIGSTTSMIFMILILLPLIFKYGVEKSRMMVIAIFAIPTLICLIIIKYLTILGIELPSQEQLNSLLPLFIILTIILLVIGSYISYQSSVKIITKKEY